MGFRRCSPSSLLLVAVLFIAVAGRDVHAKKSKHLGKSDDASPPPLAADDLDVMTFGNKPPPKKSHPEDSPPPVAVDDPVSYTHLTLPTILLV